MSEREKAALLQLPWKDIGASPSAEVLKSFGVSEENGRITKIDVIYTKGGEGTIPESISKLEHLVVLNLANMTLKGPIPLSIGQLKKLQVLNLSGNYQKFGCPIPECLGDLVELTELHLQCNNMTGTIPNSLAALKRLTVLDLAGNTLEGPHPEWVGEMKDLTVLTLNSNQKMQGTLPESIRHLKKLKKLSFTLSGLAGVIPEWIGELTELEELGFGQNGKLSGHLPSSLGNLKKLNRLDIAQSPVTGPLGEWFGGITSLANLYLNGLPINGPIPASIGALKLLKICYMQRNGFTGYLPETMRELGKVETLDLAGNVLEGTLPTWVGEMKSLTSLSLNGNKLTGTIPVSILECLNLQTIQLHENQFTGTIPEKLGQLKRLRAFNVSKNKLTGIIPVSIVECKGITSFLAAENAEMTGALPPSLRSNRVQIDIQGTQIGIGDDIEKEIALYPFTIFPVGRVLAMNRFPKHEDAVENSLKCYHYRKPFEENDFAISSLGSPIRRDKLAMISHRWLSPSADPTVAHPDDQKNSKLRHVKEVLKAHPEIKGVFMDYMCIPQVNPAEQMKAIKSLPFYIRNLGVFIVIANDEAGFQDYLKRSWCQMEIFSSLCPYPDRTKAVKEEIWQQGKVDMWCSLWNGGNRIEQPLLQKMGTSAPNPVCGMLSFENDRTNIAKVTKMVCDDMIEANYQKDKAEKYLQEADRFLASGQVPR